MRIVRGIFWWGITLITLFILDDLLFGPVFWVLSVVDPVLSTGAAFIASVIFQNWLIRAGLKEQPNKAATFFLKRLMLERKNTEIAKREESIKHRAASAAGALMVTPLIGAVIPVLLLNKHNLMSTDKLRRFSVLLTFVYGIEFALIHGGYGIGAIIRAVF